jgi:hypothetical protein
MTKINSKVTKLIQLTASYNYICHANQHKNINLMQCDALKLKENQYISLSIIHNYLKNHL